MTGATQNAPIRLRCEVPHCRRTRGQRKGEPPIESGEEWMCGKHWMSVPVFLRRRKSRLHRRYKQLFGDTPFWQFPPGSPKRLAAARLSRLREQAWHICKRAAIERAMGLR